MIKLEFYVGCGLDKDGNEIPEHEAQEACEQLRTLALHLWGGCTMLDAQGAWKSSESGRTYIERVRVFSTALPMVDPDKAGEFVHRAKRMLRQESVMVVETPCQVRFL